MAAGQERSEDRPVGGETLWTQPSRVIVVKVGVHLGEPWQAVVEQKLAEERVAGVVYCVRTSNAIWVFSGIRLRANVAKGARVRENAFYLV